jgi:hypothetical protein
VPSRRTPSSRAQRRTADDDAGTWAGRLRSVLQRLGWGAREAVAVVAGGCGAVAIVVNALFLQSGPHPAPFFNAPPPLDVPAETSVAIAIPRARPPDQPPSPPRSEATVRTEAAPAKRVIATQRALAQFGYGQIKPTGVVDGETRVAIEKFERDHKLPVTGQLSERLTRELAAMTGRSLD